MRDDTIERILLGGLVAIVLLGITVGIVGAGLGSWGAAQCVEKGYPESRLLVGTNGFRVYCVKLEHGTTVSVPLREIQR